MFRFPIPLFFRYRSKFRIPHIPVVMKLRDSYFFLLLFILFCIVVHGLRREEILYIMISLYSMRCDTIQFNHIISDDRYYILP